MDLMRIYQRRLNQIKNELLIARDWRIEAQLRFEMIDLKFKIKNLTLPTPTVLMDA